MKKFVIRLHGEQDRRMSFDSESELDCLRFFFFFYSESDFDSSPSPRGMVS